MTTTLKRTLLAASLAGAGLVGAGGIAHAGEADVSSIYGRASPSNPEIMARSGDRNVGTRAATPMQAEAADGASHPVIVARATTNPESMTPPPAQAAAADGEYLTTPSRGAAAPAEVITPTGRYLDADGSGMAAGPGETAALIHEEPLDGDPLVTGRGMRQGVDYYADPVRAEPAFHVQDVLGRSSPPAPEGAPNFGLPS